MAKIVSKKIWRPCPDPTDCVVAKQILCDSEQNLARVKKFESFYKSVKSWDAEEMKILLQKSIGDDPEFWPYLQEILKPENFGKGLFQHFKEQFIRVAHDVIVHGVDPDTLELEVGTENSMDSTDADDSDIVARLGTSLPLKSTCLPENIAKNQPDSSIHALKIQKQMKRLERKTKRALRKATYDIRLPEPKKLTVNMLAYMLENPPLREAYLLDVLNGVRPMILEGGDEIYDELNDIKIKINKLVY